MKNFGGKKNKLPFQLLKFGTPQVFLGQKIDGEHPQYYEQLHEKSQDEAREMVEQ